MIRVVQSIFKANGISYRISESKQTATFSCMMCGNEVDMDLFDSRWFCQRCNHTGTIGTIIEMMNKGVHPNPKQKIYNPSEELRAVKRSFRYLIEQSDKGKLIQRNTVFELQERVLKLFEFRELN